MTLPKIAILGAGPAGVGAAYQLRKRNLAAVTVLESQAAVGGNAGSFTWSGVQCDFGSHRLHPAIDAHILRDLRGLMGDDLLLRPRHGRIRLRGRWIHFPLKPLDLVARLPKSFALGVAWDLAKKAVPRAPRTPANFATVLERGLGTTVCRDFYFPYARKLWGVAPAELAVTTAERRVSGSSLGKMLKKVASQVPGLKAPLTGKFFYPRRGYGQITESLERAAADQGAEFLLGGRVTTIEHSAGRVTEVRYTRGGEEQSLAPHMVWSTIPLTTLVKALRPTAPEQVLEAADKITFRGMILIYLRLGQNQFTPFDAHYFPEEALPISRLSEPKNYSATSEPVGHTVLCAELPASPGDSHWGLSDEELGQRLCGWLGQAGLPVSAPLEAVATRRLPQAYPIYREGYQQHFATLTNWLDTLEGLVSFGRQGLFAHDNLHHTLAMAYGAADCLNARGDFDRQRWGELLHEFQSHVVED